MNRIRDIKGCNYLPMARTSHNLTLAWLPVNGIPSTGLPSGDRGDGLFSLANLRSELDAIKGAGFNSVRLLGSFMSHYIDPTSWRAVVNLVCSELKARRMGCTWQVWSGIPAGTAAVGIDTGGGPLIRGAQFWIEILSAYIPSTLRSAFWTVSDSFSLANSPANERSVSFWAEPFSTTEWDVQGAYAAWGDTIFKSAVNQYLADLGALFSTGVPAEVLDSFDLYNEPDVFFADATRKANVNNFIKVTHDLLRAQFANPINCTVGWAGEDTSGTLTKAVINLGVPLTYYSFHSYDRAGVGAALLAAAANLRDLPILLTECHNTAFDSGHITDYFDAMDAAGVKGYMWCYLNNGTFPPVDGVLKGDGFAKTIRIQDSITHSVVNSADDNRIRRWTGVAS